MLERVSSYEGRPTGRPSTYRADSNATLRRHHAHRRISRGRTARCVVLARKHRARWAYVALFIHRTRLRMRRNAGRDAGPLRSRPGNSRPVPSRDRPGGFGWSVDRRVVRCRASNGTFAGSARGGTGHPRTLRRDTLDMARLRSLDAYARAVGMRRATRRN